VNAGGFGVSFSPDSNYVYAGTSCGLAISSDIGATWSHTVTGAGAGAVLAVLAQPNHVVNVMSQQATAGTSGFHRSINDGTSWTVQGASPLGSAVDMHTLGASPTEPTVLFAMGTNLTNTDPFALFESDDSGATWQNLNLNVGNNGRPPFFSVHAASDGIANHLDIYAGDRADLFKQTCTGASPGLRCGTVWTRPAVDHTDNNDIAYAAGSNCPLLMSGDGGIQNTPDCGAHWHMTGAGHGGYAALQLYQVTGTVHPTHTDIYFGTQDDGLWVSPDSGATWPQLIYWEGADIEAVHSAATDVGQTVTGYACYGCNYFKEDAHWTSTNTTWTPPPGTMSSSPMIVTTGLWIQFTQTSPSTVNDLYISNDSAATWTKVAGASITEQFRPGPQPPDSLMGSTDQGKFAGPVASPTLFMPYVRTNGTVGLKKITGVRGGTVAVSTADTGITSIAQNGNGFLLWSVAPSDPTRLMAVDGAQVKISTDGGATWTANQQITSLISGNGTFGFSPESMAFDYSNPNRALIGTDSNGALATFDGGSSWMNVPNSAQIPFITGFFFDEVREDVYVSSYGRGLWKFGWCPTSGGPDATVPTFTFAPPDIVTSNCGTVNLGTPRAADVCGAAAGVTFTNDAPAKFKPGVTLVTWTAHDAAGNVSTATQRVTLILRDDPACCPAGTHIMIGTSNNDVINGTSGSDCILGGLGAQDTINGNGGDDYISGGGGDDIITGGPGNDVIFGGPGQDNINGNDGDDFIGGDDGDDIVHGGIGNDTLLGGQGQDQLFGDDGNDQLWGEAGDDTLNGGNGNDDLAAGDGLNNTCVDSSGTNTFARCQHAPSDSCADSSKDGQETDVDCGRSCLAKCAQGKLCTSSNDCASGLCSGGTCQASGGLAGSVSGLVQPWITITTDWGGGYCAMLNALNNATVPTTSWTLGLSIPGATIYTSSNGNFTGNSGNISVTPSFTWNRAIPAYATDNSISFCANRAVPTSGLLPSITSVTDQY